MENISCQKRIDIEEESLKIIDNIKFESNFINLDRILKKYNIEIRKISDSILTDKLKISVGAIFFKKDDKQIVMINKDKYKLEEDIRFTIAHELGHLFLHWKGEDRYICYRHCSEHNDDDKITEDEADYFASCLLMPEEKIKKIINTSSEMVNVESLSLIFGVSHIAMEKRLSELEIKL